MILSGFSQGLNQAGKVANGALGKVSKSAKDASGAINMIGSKAAAMSGKAGPAIQGIVTILAKMGPVGQGVALAFGGIALVIGTVITAGVKFATVLDGIAKSAKGLDMTAQGFFALQGAVIKAGGNMERTSQVILKLSDALAKAAEGSKAGQDAFRALGLSWADLKDKAPEEQLAAVVARIRELKKEGKDIPSAFRTLVGRRGMNELNKLVADESFETNLASNPRLSDKAVRNSEELTTTLAELKQGLTTWFANDDTMLVVLRTINNVVQAIARKVGGGVTAYSNIKGYEGIGNAWGGMKHDERVLAVAGKKTTKDIVSDIYGAFYNDVNDKDTAFGKLNIDDYREFLESNLGELGGFTDSGNLEDLLKKLRELEKTDPEKLTRLFTDLVELDIRDTGEGNGKGKWGMRQAAGLLNWDGYSYDDVTTWFRKRENNQTSAPSVNTSTTSASSNKSPLDIETLESAYDDEQIKKLFNDVAKYSDEATRKSLETFYTQLEMSGVTEGEQAADKLLEGIREAFAESSSPDEIKRRLSVMAQDLSQKIPDALSEEHREFIEKILDDIKKDRDRALQFKNDQEYSSNIQKTFEASFAGYQKRLNGLVDSMKGTQDKGDKIHTNELAEKGGFVGGVTVERSAYEHTMKIYMEQVKALMNMMNTQLSNMNIQLRNY